MKGSIAKQLAVPAVHFFLLFALGIFIADVTAPDGIHALIAAGATMVCAAALRSTGRRVKGSAALSQLLLSVSIVCAGACRGAAEGGDADTALLPFSDTRERCTVEGIVETTPARGRERMSFRLAVRSVTRGARKIAVRGRTMVYYSKSAYDREDTLRDVELGDMLSVEGALRSIRPARNPGAFDARLYYRRQGLSTVLSAPEGSRVRVLGRFRAKNPIQALSDASSGYIRNGLNALFAGEDADIMVGLVLGERGDIDANINRAFRDAGVIHILAVSGLHVALVLLFVWIPLGRMPFLPRVIVALAVLWLYAMMTGMIAPVLRAAVMATVFLVGRALQRIPHTMNALGVAGIAILSVAPMELFSASFQLSFAAVFAIVAFHGSCVRWMKTRLLGGRSSPAGEALISMLSMTVTAQAGTLPFILGTFRQFSVVSFAANLAVVPLSSLVMAAGIPAAVFHGLGPFPSRALAATADAALDLTVGISDALAGLPFAVAHVREFSSVSSVLYIAALLYVFAKPVRVRYRACLAALALACWTAVSGGMEVDEEARCLRVTFLDVGQGDATLVEFPDGANLLIDTGPISDRFDTGESVLLPFLRSRAIGRIDALVLTHPDNDHIGGAGAVLEALDVGRVYYAGTWAPEPLSMHVDSLMHLEGSFLRDARAGDTIGLNGQARVYVLSPARGSAPLPASNETSVVLKIVYGSTSFLLTGDAEAGAEETMVHRYADFLGSDVYKVGHHGSRTSTTPEFLASVSPRHAVISCGRLNKFLHPRPEILRRLARMRAAVYRTDITGCVVLESDGKAIRSIDWQAGEK